MQKWKDEWIKKLKINEFINLRISEWMNKHE